MLTDIPLMDVSYQSAMTEDSADAIAPSLS